MHILRSHKLLFLICLFGLFLRSYHLDSYPSLNPDEASLGYNAYSLIKTGKDEHGTSWPIHFKSFGDYKPGGYVYVLLPFIKFFGLNTLSVRLPNLIASVLILALAYKIVNFLSKNTSLSLLTTFFLSISPWAIHFSRGAWESNFAFFLILAATYCFLKNHLIFSALFFSASLYTYHSARLFVPLLIIFLITSNIVNRKKFVSKKHIIFLLSMAFFSLPVVFSFLNTGGTSRFAGVGLGADQGPIWRANELINDHHTTKLAVRLLHNKRVLYLLSWAEKYTSHFNLNFLFLNGDQVPRSKVPNMGESYLIFLPFFLFGLLSLLNKETPPKFRNLLIFWLLASPLASSLTYQAPSSLRSLPEVFAVEAISAFGLYHFIYHIKQKAKLLLSTSIVFCLLIVYSVGFYLVNYYLLYTSEYPQAWPWGAKEAIAKKDYDQINADQPYIMYLFYTAYDPQKLQKQIQLTPPDQYGFSTVNKIDNITFSSKK